MAIGYTINCQAANDGVLNFSANVISGTCEFSSNNELSKQIVFEQFFSVDDANAASIKTPIKGNAGIKQFTYTIDCKEYEPNSEKNININVKTGNNTEYSDQVFFAKDDTTQTGFLVKGCIEGKAESCQILENNKKLSFTTNLDTAINIDYTVNFVRRSNSNVSPGDSTATILFEYLQD